VVTKSGQYSLGDPLGETLKPFFEEIYDSCGMSRREWQDK
jgi:hypothetical protein